MEIHIYKTDSSDSNIIRCVDVPYNNWMKLFVGELGRTKEGKYSELWERVGIDIIENDTKIYSTTNNTIPEKFIDFIINESNKNKNTRIKFPIITHELINTYKN